MKKNRNARRFGKRMLSMTLAVTIFALLLSGCAGFTTSKVSNEGDELTYCMKLGDSMKLVITDFGETPIGKKWSEDTGIKVKYQHPESDEQFNLMISSNNLPDIVETNWVTFPGGPAKAISDNQIKGFDEKTMKEKAPNFMAYINAHPELKKMCTTDDGTYYMFPFIRGDKSLTVSNGPVVRKDWLDDLGMNVPETMDDWYKMLSAFKNKKGASAPLVLSTLSSLYAGMFSGAYGAPRDFFVDDNGKIQFGGILDGYKECLTELNKWYNEGLLDKNFMGNDAKNVGSSMTNGTSGAAYAAIGSGIGAWMAAAPDDKYEVCAAPYPVLNRGEKCMYGNAWNIIYGYGAAISTSCKDIDSAMKLLDYCYSEKGSMLMNFGIEGESYEMVDGYPTYTDLITKNPEGLSMASALYKYTRAAYQGPFVQDKRYMEQYGSLPQQKEALTVWSNTDAENHIMPPILPTEKENSELSKITSDCFTCLDEYTVRFISGTESFDNWDSFVEKIKSLNVERAIEIYQAAYDRYINK